MTATSEHTHKQKEQRYRKEQRETMGSTRREGVIQWGLRYQNTGSIQGSIPAFPYFLSVE